MRLNKNNNIHSGHYLLAFAAMMLVSATTFAAAQTLGSLATTITSSFASLAKLITAGSYMAGLAFAVGAIMKFKQHKDSPNQIPIGTPIAMLFIAAALLFLPTVLGIAGASIFGTGAKIGGPTGIVFTAGGS